jgi:hypothetical protein
VVPDGMENLYDSHDAEFADAMDDLPTKLVSGKALLFDSWCTH